MRVSINMATFPARENTLKRVVDSVINQCDILRIYLNEFEYIPEYLINEKIELAFQMPNIKDTGKFYWANTYKHEYYFTIDDDIIYPENFVQDTIKAMKLNGANICTCHGRVLKENAVDIDAKNVISFYPCKQLQIETTWVNYAGTGAMCFDNSAIILPHDVFTQNGMTDQFFAVAMQQMKEPILCRSHSPFELINYDDCLWTTRNKQLNNELFEGVKWRVYKPNEKPVYVVTPTYNNAKYLESFLKSLKKQNCNIVVGVDGCRETLAKAKELKQKYNFELYSYAKNKGAYITLNSLIRHLPSDTIVIIAGSDDVMHNDFVQRMKDNRPCYSRYTGVICFEKWQYDELGGFINWRFGADTEFSTRFKRLYLLTKIEQLYDYRQHEGQLTKQNTDRTKEWEHIHTVSLHGKVKIKPVFHEKEVKL